jgi:integrase
VRFGKFLRTVDFADRPIGSITSDDIARWRDELQATLAPSSARREYGLIRALFAVATREWRWLRVSPFASLRPPPPGQPRSQRVSDDDAAMIVARLGWNGTRPETAGQYVAAAFLMSLHTALRQGEVLGAIRADCDVQRRILRVQRSKNGETRDVPLSQAALGLLALLPDDGYLFPIAAGTCDTLFRRARDAAGLKHIHFHDARREATTRMAARVDVLTLAKITGHRDVNLLNRVYYAPSMSDVARMLD